ncbi:transcriptional regulatory protein GlnR [Mobilicoccus pelagius NBRC 104925]|uniref:Transcriptional regulatory protein GlnR n=1 Tax=Mobilicoccus pelagius NBRC 104925 TaxID=1089455 RepID=H5UN44_9MICO|nr:transcriptional regulatory protein GlnR [Mobilicoccus pelagius NBRC 104925]
MLLSRRTLEEVLPALTLLPHPIRVVADVGDLASVVADVVVLVDAVTDLVGARATCRRVAIALPDLPVVAVVTEGGLAALTPEWRLADVVLQSAGPTEIDARLRLTAARRLAPDDDAASAPTAREPAAGGLVVDESGYTARVDGVPLDLTYKEFELLKHLTSSPGHVFTRAQILEDVWGYDYYGGTRTVDVHVRRLRAKLGPEHEGLIGTVRGVGYRYQNPARSTP